MTDATLLKSCPSSFWMAASDTRLKVVFIGDIMPRKPERFACISAGSFKHIVDEMFFKHPDKRSITGGIDSVADIMRLKDIDAVPLINGILFLKPAQPRSGVVTELPVVHSSTAISAPEYSRSACILNTLI